MGRRALPVVAALVAGLVAVPGALAARSPRKAIRPADQALARSIVVRQSDLPPGSWKSEPGSSGGSTPDCPRLQIDLSDLTATGQASGRTFQERRTATFVSSGAGILRTEAEARTWYSRFVRPQIARCFADVFKAGLGKDVKAKIVSAGRVPFPRLTDATAAYRVVGDLSAGGQRIRMYLDLAILREDRADAVVIAIGLARPFAQFRSIATAVARRMDRA